ncbi:hypothetical protein D9615_007928 [Tricholomella constricta]|uniref:Uncharacterized protein n=1 Tax=Tricholomella constricta TaxID=117010 RepID=A0A8H5H2T6_9AGAR|nr:hypothetical protein D9615_007928 [Tricholomella constricta]
MRDPFFLPDREDNGLNLQEQRESQRPLNESYYFPPYEFPSKGQDHTVYDINTNTNSQPQYHKPGEPPRSTTATMGGIKPTTTTTTAAAAATAKKGPGGQYRRDRERLLSNTPVETLIQRLITQEYETKESRKLLRSAITQLDALKHRADTAEEARRALEAGQALRGLKVSQSVMDAQEETAKAKQDAEVYRMQLEWAQRELRQNQDVIKTVEQQRDHADKAAAKARALARQLNEERLVAMAREEGHKQGYVEGMQQGRMLALGDGGMLRRRQVADRPHQTPLGSGQAFIEEQDEDDDMPPPQPSRHPTPDLPRGVIGNGSRRRHESRDGTPRGRSSVPRGLPATHTPRSQPASSIPTRSSTPANDAVRQELDAAKERMEETVRREAEQRETIRQWELREAQREREAERERVKQKEAALEREKEEMRAKEEARQREMQELLEREREKERELERQRNEERHRREEREQELEREREKVRELERQRELEHQRERERERDGSSNSSHSQRNSLRSTRLPYLRMPPPPPSIIVEPPHDPPALEFSETPPLRIPPPRPHPIQVPQQIQPLPYPRGHRRQPSSPDTSHSDASVTTGMSNLDIITFPHPTSRGVDGDWERTNLSDIPEVPSIRSHSRASVSEAPSPTWLTNPPTDFTRTGGPDVDQWRHSTGNDPPDSNATSPATTPVQDLLSPSFQPRGRASERSIYGNQPRGSSGSTVHITVEPPSRPPSSAGIRDTEAAGFLSPNSRPLSLVPDEPPEPPVIPDMVNFPPPGFVPYNTTTISTSDSGSAAGRDDRDHAHGHNRQGSRTGSNIYANFTPPVQFNTNLPFQGTSRQPPATRTGSSIYANAPLPQGPYSSNTIASQTPRQTPRQIYASSSPSVSGTQALPQHSSRIYSGEHGAATPRTTFYAPPSSSTASQTPRQSTRQIYAPTPPSLSGTQPLQAADPSRIYANPSISKPRHQIYGPSRSGPVIPPPPSIASSIYGPPASASPSQPSMPLRSSRNSGSVSGPVIPPPPAPRGMNIYSPSQPPPPRPLEPFIPPPPANLTPRGGNNIRPDATPRSRFSNVYAEPPGDDGVDHDEETMYNTHINKVFGGSPLNAQPPLPIPPPGNRR